MPDDARRRLGRRLPQQLLPHHRGAGAPAASRTGCWPGRGRTPTRRPRCPGRGSTSTRDGRPGATGGCAARRGDDDVETAGCDVFVRTSTRPEPDLDLHEGHVGARTVARPAPPWQRRTPLDGPAVAGGASPTSAPPPGSTAPATCPGASPATSAYDDARSLTWEWAPHGRRWSATPGLPAPAQRRRARGLAVGEALRRLPRRHLGAGRPGHRSTSPSATACTAHPRRSCPARSTTSSSTLDACAYAFAPGPADAALGRRGRLAEHRRSARPR